MAAENEDTRPDEPGGERRTGQDRRRPPLTIDLTAKPVARAETPPAPPEPPVSAAAESKGPPEAKAAPSEPRRPAEPPRPAEPKVRRPAVGGLPPDSEHWVGLGVAGAVGGVVALVLLLLLQATGLVPAPGVVAASQASIRAQSVADSVTTLERRLMAVEAMTDGLPTTRSDVSGLASRLAQLEQGARSLAPRTDIDTLRTDLAALGSRIANMPPGAAAAELTALANRVGRLESSLSGPPSAAGASPDVETRIAALTNRVEALEMTGSRPAVAAPTPPAADTARTAALALLTRAVDTGAPFAAELDTAARLGGSEAAAALRPYASAGVPSRDMLRAEFAPLADAIIAATPPEPDNSFFGRIVSGARGLVTIRPTGPVAGSDPPAIVSRIEAAVAKGDLATALAEREQLPQAGKDVSATWAARANARLAADGFMAQLTAALGRTNDR